MREGELLPSKKPDIDNVLKIVLDALNGVAYKDDSKVVSVSGKKIYSDEPKLVIEMKGSD
jgi:Holliday junction resolvase RusA-like endonuclease